MNKVHVVSGVLLFVIFAALSSMGSALLGSFLWIAAIVIFVAIMVVMGKKGMPKAPEDIKSAWMFAVAFSVIVTAMMTAASPYMGSGTPDQVGNYMMAFWLVVFGGVMFAGAMSMKMTSGMVLGLVWLFSSVYFVTGTGSASAGLMWFGILTGIPFIIMGLQMKK